MRYWKEHPELGIGKCAKNLGISKSTLSTWGKAYNENEGSVPTRGRGNYESDEKGEYDLSIRTVTAEFFASLEKDTAEGKYFKLETTGERVQDCTALAWKQVWRLSTEGKLKRAFATDIESSVPKEYTKDGKAHCYLYISLRQE